MESIVLVDDEGNVVCECCRVADRPASRMRGLLGRAELPRGAGILFSPAWAVHTFFMRFAVDAVFLDDDLRVMAVAERVRPFRAAWRRGAAMVLELGAGEAGRLQIVPGGRLAWGKRSLAVVA